MRSKVKNFLLVVSLLVTSTAFCQEIRQGSNVICNVDPNQYNSKVPLRARLAHLGHEDLREKVRANDEFKSTFIVNYAGFTEEAQNAFQFAVDIWASLLISDVPIIVNASFEQLDAGVLGSAGASFLVRDFKNAPSDTTFYPIALAEKLSGMQLNNPDQSEINCRFNSDFGWYFGTDGNPGDDFDFISVVLHELGHGLGFAGASDVDDDGIGSWDYINNKSGRYNQFVETGDGRSFLDVPNSTTELADVLTGGDIYWNGPLAVETLGERPLLFAPSPYRPGSSFSHLDETEFEPGGENSLMSPSFGRGEAIFDPGVSLDIFADMGWFATVLDHEVARDVVDNLTDDITVEVQLRSDTNIVSNELKVVYSIDDFATSSEIALSEVSTNVYVASIPNPGVEASLSYYFDGVSDGLGRDVRSPSTGAYTTQVRDVILVSVPFTLADGDFEGGAAGFYSIPIDGNTNIWELGTPSNELQTSSSSTSVWKTDLDADIAFTDVDYKCALVSPYFDLKDSLANYTLSFELGMELGEGETSGGDAFLFESGPVGANVEVTTDGGATWQVLGSEGDGAGENWYNFQNTAGDVILRNVFNNDPGWVIDSVNSVNVKYNISRLSDNDSVAFRIVLNVEADFDVEGYQTDGVLVDNFEITKEDPTADFVVASEGNFFFSGQTISFEHVSRGATSYEWDFGDGTASTQKNPDHVYQSGGVYDVSLTIQYAGGSDLVVQNGLVTVIAEAGSSLTLEEGGNFEADNGLFAIDNISGTGFERGNSTVAGKDGTASGDFAIVTGLDEEEYANQSQAFIYTPVFDFSSLGTYTLSFAANYQTEEAWDGFIIEYTDDNAETWNQLVPEVQDDWYDVIGENNPTEGWPAIPLFSGSTGGEFVTKSIDLSDFGGTGKIGFRFHWLSDFAVIDVGVAIDDFQLQGPTAGPGVPDFSFTNATGCEGQVVVFTNESTGTITSAEWDFGTNATPATATGVGPHSVTYSGSGASTVTLTITSPENGEVVEQKVDVIETSPLHEPTFTRTNNNDGTYSLTASDGDAYQWFRDGEEIEGETNRTLIVPLGDGGRFYAVVTVGSCGVQTASEIINGIVEESLAVYPNPASSVLKIRSELPLQGNYQITTMTGKLVKTNVLDGSSLDINIDSIAEGVYFLHLNTKGEDRVIRFVVDR